MEKKGPDHYRFVELYDQDGVFIHRRTFCVIGETPQCYWVVPEHNFKVANAYGRGKEAYLKRYRKLVLKGARARWCNADMQEAFYSYVRRKRMHVSNAKLSVAVAEQAYAKAKDVYDNHKHLIDTIGVANGGQGLDCGIPEYFGSLNWTEC